MRWGRIDNLGIQHTRVCGININTPTIFVITLLIQILSKIYADLKKSPLGVAGVSPTRPATFHQVWTGVQMYTSTDVHSWYERHCKMSNSNSFALANLSPPESFELMATKLSTGNKETIFLNIYRPPSSKISTFLDEFQNLLEIFVPSPSELIISGDFNIHTDSDLTTPHKFSGILDNFHLTQHINFPTHDDGHTLDLLITRSSSTVGQPPFSPRILPVRSQIIHIQIFPTHPPSNWKNNHTIPLLQKHWCRELQKWHPHFPLYTNPASNASDLADQLSSTLKSILDIHAPIKSKLLSKDPTPHGLIPKFYKPSENVVDLSDVGVAGSLPLTAWNSEPNAT